MNEIITGKSIRDISCRALIPCMPDDSRGEGEVIISLRVILSSLAFQIKVPSLKARCYHSATAIPHTPTLVEVVLFGGMPEWPKDYKTADDFPQIGNTVVLRFGESTSCVCPSIVILGGPFCEFSGGVLRTHYQH